MWIVIVGVLLAGIFAWIKFPLGGVADSTEGVYSAARDERVLAWINAPGDHPDWVMEANTRCGNAPFAMPARGYIGYLWDDGFQRGHRHQGIDIFAGTQPGDTPVYAAADGYLTRQADWKSSVIIRIPQDPLNPSRAIWTYYTHMADPQGNSLIAADFPPGAQGVFVRAGMLLGHQGNYSGTPGSPVGVHLHFSIVLESSEGRFANELDIHNTLDPSPYLGLGLNARSNPPDIPLCSPINGENP